MTLGTFFLFWLGRLSPVTPLRSRTAYQPQWQSISIRTQPSHAVRGFYHLRIDEAGRLFQSDAWQGAKHQRDAIGAIQVLLTCDDPARRITAAQTTTLTRTIADLRDRHRIPGEAVHIETGRSAGEPPRQLSRSAADDY